MPALITSKPQRFDWKTIVTFALAFWLSGSLLLDFVFMPTLYVTGMTTEPGFATAGYTFFGLFNRIELLCAAIVLTGVLVLQQTNPALDQARHWMLPLAIGLVGIVLVCTYELAPEMSALGLQLNLFDPATVPAAMNQMHLQYWALELMKLVATATLLNFCYRHKAAA